MASDRRPRNGAQQRRRPAEDEFDDSRPPRRDPRRRTAFVPRQGTPRAGRQAPRSTSPERRRQRPQQPPYRQRESEPVDEQYDDSNYDDYLVEDDRVIEGDRRFAQAPSSRRPQRRSRASRREAYDDPYIDDAEYLAIDGDDDGYDDSFIDEDDWYEEEAAAGAAAPRRGRTARQPRSMPRPNISVSRPNIPRPVVPERVKQAALVQDQHALVIIGGLVLSVIVLALLTMNRVDSLAPSFATRISASGVQEAIRSQQALWQLPLMAGALLLMNIVLAWFVANYSRFSSRLLLISSAIVQVLIWVAFIRIAF